MATTLYLTDGTISSSQHGGYVVESVQSGRRYVALLTTSGDFELYALEAVERAGDDDRESAQNRTQFMTAMARNGSLAYVSDRVREFLKR